MTTPDTEKINAGFKELTREVGAEHDAEKATAILVAGIGEQLGRLKTNSVYNTLAVDAFIEQMRAHGPMWAQAVTVVGSPERAGSAR